MLNYTKYGDFVRIFLIIALDCCQKYCCIRDVVDILLC